MTGVRVGEGKGGWRGRGEGVARDTQEKGRKRIRERKGIEVHGRVIEVEKREESEKTQ